jgi:hypothetical protein
MKTENIITMAVKVSKFSLLILFSMKKEEKEDNSQKRG